LENLLPKIIKVIRFWIVGYCTGVILQRIIHVIIANYFGFNSEVTPLSKITNSAAYELSLPFVAIVHFPIFVLVSFSFFVDAEFENPKEIYKQGLELILLFAILTFLADMFIWVITPLPAQVSFFEFFLKNGYWQVLKYLLIGLATFLGVRPYFIKKAKSL